MSVQREGESLEKMREMYKTESVNTLLGGFQKAAGSLSSSTPEDL